MTKETEKKLEADSQIVKLDEIELSDENRLRDDDDQKTIEEYEETYSDRKDTDQIFQDYCNDNNLSWDSIVLDDPGMIPDGAKSVIVGRESSRSQKTHGDPKNNEIGSFLKEKRIDPVGIEECYESGHLSPLAESLKTNNPKRHLPRFFDWLIKMIRKYLGLVSSDENVYFLFFSPDRLARPIAYSKQNQLCEFNETDRAILCCLLHSHIKESFERIRIVFVHNDSPSEIRRLQSELGQTAGNRGGRPRKRIPGCKKRLNEKWKNAAIELARLYAQNARMVQEWIESQSGDSISLRTLQRWLHDANAASSEGRPPKKQPEI